jgi:hypothetical protein
MAHHRSIEPRACRRRAPRARARAAAAAAAAPPPPRAACAAGPALASIGGAAQLGTAAIHQAPKSLTCTEHVHTQHCLLAPTLPTVTTLAAASAEKRREEKRPLLLAGAGQRAGKTIMAEHQNSSNTQPQNVGDGTTETSTAALGAPLLGQAQQGRGLSGIPPQRPQASSSGEQQQVESVRQQLWPQQQPPQQQPPPPHPRPQYNIDSSMEVAGFNQAPSVPGPMTAPPAATQAPHQPYSPGGYPNSQPQPVVGGYPASSQPWQQASQQYQQQQPENQQQHQHPPYYPQQPESQYQQQQQQYHQHHQHAAVRTQTIILLNYAHYENVMFVRSRAYLWSLF